MEKRRERRYARRFRVRFGEKQFTQSGFTSDVSATGMFIVTAQMPKVGQRLHVEVTIENERVVYVEGVVARMSIVAPELRSVMKGGFGLRFLLGAELAAEMVPHLRDQKRITVSYATKEELAAAFDKELANGGLMVRVTTAHTVNTIVSVEVDAVFAQRRLGFECRVVHVTPAAGKFGVALTFLEPQAAIAALGALAGK